MTLTKIWKMLNQITPNKTVYGLACSMASLDTQTVLELIDKYKKDITLSEKEIKNELIKQRLRRANI